MKPTGDFPVRSNVLFYLLTLVHKFYIGDNKVSTFRLESFDDDSGFKSFEN